MENLASTALFRFVLALFVHIKAESLPCRY